MHVEVGGLNIAFERAGTGPAVVLAHGFVGDARSTWGGQIDALSDEFTVIAWDAPGAGGSTDPPEDFGMDAYADCLADFLRALRIERAHLVGLSFGGALVLAAFHRHRGLASSLTLVSGYAGWLGSLGTEEADQRLARSLEASRLAPDEFVAAMAPSMFSPSAEWNSWLRSSTACVRSDRAVSGRWHSPATRTSATCWLRSTYRRSCCTPTTTYVLQSRSVSHCTAHCQGPNLSYSPDQATPARWRPRTRSPANCFASCTRLSSRPRDGRSPPIGYLFFCSMTGL